MAGLTADCYNHEGVPLALIMCTPDGIVAITVPEHVDNHQPFSKTLEEVAAHMRAHEDHHG